MNKTDFLNDLSTALSGLPQTEIQKSLDYYSEIIDDASEDGEDEQAVIERLGSVNIIAEKIINETPLTTLVKENIRNRHISAAAAVLLILGSPLWISLSVAALAIVFAFYISIWAILISLFACCIASAAAGAVLLIASPFIVAENALQAALAFGLSLMSIGAAIFLLYLSVFLTKQLIKLTIYTARKIKNSVIRKGDTSNDKK